MRSHLHPAGTVRASAELPVEPAWAFTILADYQDPDGGHAAILPSPPFTGLTVEQGGRGDGTVARAHVKLLGLKSGFGFVVTEPEPGRVLVETNDNGGITTFTVDPIPDRPDACRVTIETRLPPGRSPFAALNRLFLTRLLRRTLPRELAQLACVATQHAAPGPR